MRSIARMIACFGGCGFSPKAPGTVGSLAALLVGIPLLQHVAWMGMAITVCCVIGYWATAMVSNGEDHGWIVIDEVAGMWLSMWPLAPLSSFSLRGADFLWLALAFALFRLFDITKPGPGGWFARRPGAVGIRGDDGVAGMGAGLIVMALHAIA